MKGLAVHYLVCAMHGRIKILQKAREWFVAITEDNGWTENREKEKSSTLI